MVNRLPAKEINRINKLMLTDDAKTTRIYNHHVLVLLYFANIGLRHHSSNKSESDIVKGINKVAKLGAFDE